MTKLAKALAGTVAAGAMAVSAVAPAQARDRDRDGISAGEVIAGALIIGGIAAAASSIGKDRYRDGYRYDDRRYRDRYRYDRAGYGGRYRDNPRTAVEQCVRSAERDASRYTYGRAQVTDIRSVRDKRDGYDVRGRIAVNSYGRSYRGSSRYGRGWGGDYRGWNNNLRGYDSGKFTCKVRYGRVVDLDYSGIRRLR